MYDIVRVGGFAIERDLSSITVAKRAAKEGSKDGSLVQVIDLNSGYAIAEYENGKPTQNRAHFKFKKL
jgi:hypothetical protein